MINEIQVLLDSIQAAGAAILDVRKSGFSVSTKSNNDIVTKADLLANDILKSQLTSAFPGYGWLSEESVDDNERLACERVWVVDPIDGTREFATHIPEYAVSVALVERGAPVLAAIFNPATDELFHAAKGLGAFLNKTKIFCQETSVDDILLLASRSEYKRGEWNKFQLVHKVKQVGSIAYKLALIAAGHAQATFSLGPKNEWDIAAGTLLVTEAGGVVSDKQKELLMFNRSQVKVNGVVATTSGSNNQIFNLINS